MSIPFDAKQPWPTLDKIKKVHIVGVGGTLMGNFAAFLKKRGIEVTGSDQNIYPPMSDVLARAQVKVFSPYSPQNFLGLSPRPDLVIIGNVISKTHEEAAAAISSGVRYASLPETMENLLLPKTQNLVVAGTHGKTTTSSLLAFVLRELKQDPSYFFGGVAHDFTDSFYVGALQERSPFVLEGDEYDTAFWDKVPKFNHYLPDHAVLTSVEYDHADIYPNFEALYRAFEGLIDRIRLPGGSLMACVDYPSVRTLAERAQKRGVEVHTYGVQKDGGDQNARFQAAGVRSLGSGKFGFEILENGKSVATLESQLPGTYNAANTTAVWLICRKLKLDSKAVAAAIAKFRGVKRRQEVVAEVNGITVIDDFAHHPTAVRETLKGLGTKYAGRRIVAVFEPRSATSRRKVFQKEYVEAFLSQASESFIASPYDTSKIAADDQFSTAQLISDLKAKGANASFFTEVVEGVELVTKSCRPGDVVVVMSNGGFNGFIPKLVQSLTVLG